MTINQPLLAFCISLGTACFFWANTNFLYFYFKLVLTPFNRRVPYYQAYKDARQHGDIQYLKYLAYQTDSFCLNLISCPLCLILLITLFFAFGLTMATPIPFSLMTLFIVWGPVGLITTVTYFILAILKKLT